MSLLNKPTNSDIFAMKDLIFSLKGDMMRYPFFSFELESESLLPKSLNAEDNF